MYDTIQCIGAHAPKLPSSVKKDIKRSASSKKALRAVEKYFFKQPGFKSLTGSTQAIDMIQGGVKSNALPERVWAIVNHRIATERSIGLLKR